ncbi:MAG: tetratricopeptide repeat protein [Deltaproteobacteria bacterium]|nr:tetratricopeptide repeat protein [Deltaproteobacteria bacterium]
MARRTLDEALDLCDKSGLGDHPIKARTLIHMGVVVLASGVGQREEAIKYFQKALTIQPDIKPSERVANPEVQSAFGDAKGAGASVPVAPGKFDKGAPSKTAAPAATSVPSGPAIEAAPATPGVAHDAIKSGEQESVIPISVTTDPSLAAKKVAMWFRPAGSSKFTSIDLREYTPGNWSGSIPDTATEGDDVAYFISAENGNGEVVGTQGSASAPMVIKLKAEPVVEAKRPVIEDPGEYVEPTPPREDPEWYLGLAVGTGMGWTTGNGDISNQDKVTSAFGRSQLGHVLPEVGFFVDTNMILSLQLRLQYITGATPIADLDKTMCGANHICEPATGAAAALARLTWLLGEGTFVPYLSGAVGAGQIRHLATFPNNVNCGTDPLKPAVKCVDTVAAGPILLGPGAGFILHVTPNFGLTVGMATLLAFPVFTFHVDVNAGVVVEL